MLRYGTIAGALIAGALSTLFLRAKQTRKRATAAVQRRTRKVAAHVKRSTTRHK
jgi:hypothetical protein